MHTSCAWLYSTKLQANPRCCTRCLNTWNASGEATALAGAATAAAAATGCEGEGANGCQLELEGAAAAVERRSVMDYYGASGEQAKTSTTSTSTTMKNTLNQLYVVSAVHRRCVVYAIRCVQL